MNKKTRNIIFVSVLIAVAIIGFYAFKADFGFLTIPGFNTIGLSSAQFTSTSSFLSGNQFILTVIQGGLGQHIEGTVTSQEIQSQTGKQVQDNFKITLDYSRQDCSYTINRDAIASPIYKFNTQEWGCVLQPSQADAQSRCGGILTMYGKSSLGTCVCASKVIVGNWIANLGNPEVNNDLQVSSQIGTNAVNSLRIITPNGNDRGALGTNAYVVWNGNSVTGASCPSTSAVKPIYQGGYWKLYSVSNYNTYESSRVSLESDIRSVTNSGDVAPYWSSIKNKASYLNTQADSLFNNQVSFGTIDSSSTVDGAKARVELTQGIQKPILTFYVKADALRIFTPVADPVILSSGSSCFRTGTSDGKITVVVKNQGTQAGNVRVSAECNSPFTATSQDLYLNAGGTATAILAVTASTNQQEQRSSCTVRVVSVDKTDSEAVSVCVQSPPALCQPGQNLCVGQDRLLCDSSGLSYSVVEKCTGQCQAEDGQTKCISGSSGGGDISNSCKWYDLPCLLDKLTGGLLTKIGIAITTIKWIVVIIAVIFSFIISRDFTLMIIRKKNERPLVYIIATLFAAGIGIALYLVLLTALFWMIILGYLVFLSLIKFTPLGKIFGMVRRK